VCAKRFLFFDFRLAQHRRMSPSDRASPGRRAYTRGRQSWRRREATEKYNLEKTDGLFAEWVVAMEIRFPTASPSAMPC